MAFPQSQLPVLVELGDIVTPGVWTDVTPDVLVRDGITLTRGRSDEASQAAPQTCTLTFNNGGGKYSPRNPVGPYFGRLGRNTPIRVSVSGKDTAPTFDASSTANGSGDLSWTHTPVGVPRGVVVTVVVDDGSSSLLPTGVTYGGVTLTQLHSASWNAGGGLLGGFAVYHRGGGLPPGPQTVVVDTPDGFPGPRVASAVTFTGAFDTVASASAVTTGATANPTNAFTATDASLVLGVCNSAHDAVTQISPGAGYVDISEHDFGTEVVSFTRRTTAVTGAGSTLWTSAATNWAALSVVVSSGTSVRFVGEVSEWPPRWDASESDSFVPVTASGILRRLGQGRPPLLTGLKNYILTNNPNNYWPLDEGELAGYGRNASEGSSFRFYPWPTSGIFRPVIKFGAGELGFNLPNGLQILRTNAQGASEPYVRGDVAFTSTELAVDFVFRLPAVAAQLTLFVRDYNNNQWELTLRQGAFDDVQLGRTVISTGVTTGISDSGPLDELTDGELHHLRLSLAQSGADVAYNVYIDGQAVLGGTVSSVTMNGCSIIYFQYPQLTNEQPMALGHVAVWKTLPDPPIDAYNAMTGYVGETAGNRMDRVCGEELIGFTGIGDLDDTAPMGPQIEGDALAQVRDAVAADMGTLYEPRDTLGLVYRTRGATYNQTPTLTIDYSASELSPPFEPTDDDQLTRNDITATKSGGGSARQVLTTGRLSTAEPPGGVGPYRDEVTVNVASEDQLGDVAGWLLLNGTWDEARYPVVRVERAAPDVAGNATLSNALLDVDIDDLVAITGLESVGIYEDVKLLVRGYSETLLPFSHTFDFNCSPYGPYRTGVYNSDIATTGSRYSPGGFNGSGFNSVRLWESLTTSETAAEILIDSGGLLSDDDAPFDIVIGGERMTVTAVDTQTIQFVANGTNDAQNNAPVNPGLPPGTQAGDLVLIFASIRNSGVGTPNLPTGWVQVIDMGNARVFARHYDGVWTMPTITFTGGVAGEDTIAQACSFRGISIGVFALTQLNASAQNIALPFFGSTGGVGRLILWCGWKQDDWTSVATLAYPGVLEIQERTSGLGNDASQVWAFKILTDPHESVPSLSFVVSGGAAAISRGATAMFWPGQTLTVVRSVNGVVKAHSSGAAVELYEPARYAL